MVCQIVVEAFSSVKVTSLNPEHLFYMTVSIPISSKPVLETKGKVWLVEKLQLNLYKWWETQIPHEYCESKGMCHAAIAELLDISSSLWTFSSSGIPYTFDLSIGFPS